LQHDLTGTHSGLFLADVSIAQRLSATERKAQHESGRIASQP
jgi:hypothetical protein